MAHAEVEHQGIPDWGIDLPFDRRPGVPREAKPRPYPAASWIIPEQQVPTVPVLKRSDLLDLTPVFGTSVPPRGLSGRIRQLAYASPDHRTLHWALLLAADRVDVVESSLSGFMGRAQRQAARAANAGSLLVKERQPRRRVNTGQPAIGHD